jgi:hypothetical protein
MYEDQVNSVKKNAIAWTADGGLSHPVGSWCHWQMRECRWTVGVTPALLVSCGRTRMGLMPKKHPAQKNTPPRIGSWRGVWVHGKHPGDWARGWVAQPNFAILAIRSAVRVE